MWTSYSDEAEWCLLLARTDHDVAKHRGISAFAVPMGQPGIEQRPLRMINGVTKEFGEVLFDDARVPAANMIGEPGEGWPLAMTVVSHEREPGELGYVARYSKVVNDLTRRVTSHPGRVRPEQVRELGWAIVEVEMLRLHVRRRLSDRLDGITHGPQGSVDKLLMTWVEQAVGHAALADRRDGPRRRGRHPVEHLPVQPGPERHGRARRRSSGTWWPAGSWACPGRERRRPSDRPSTHRLLSSLGAPTGGTPWSSPRHLRPSTARPAVGMPSP